MIYKEYTRYIKFPDQTFLVPAKWKAHSNMMKTSLALAGEVFICVLIRMRLYIDSGKTFIVGEAKALVRASIHSLHALRL